ncbi:MAG: Flp pilus assembly complex ATPase component TadA [Planctomycetes bacterium]|nr:Flp pilus assembly complex ATPase component TadA [Planctomycetota bacterium]
MSPSIAQEALITRLLMESGELTADALEDFKGTLAPGMVVDGRLLMAEKVVDERTVARRYAEHLGISYLDLTVEEQPRITETYPGDEPRVLGTLAEMGDEVRAASAVLPEKVCIDRRVLGVFRRDGGLHVALINPADFRTIEELRMLSGTPLVAHAVTLSLYDAISREILGSNSKVREIILEAGDDAEASAVKERDEGVDVDVKRALPDGKDSQVLRIVNMLLLQAIEEGASDIHLEPYEKTVRVRFRVDGHLREVTPPPPWIFSQIVSRLKILAKMDIAERRKPQDGGITLKDGDSRVDLRASTVPTVYGEKMVLRVLEKGNIPERLELLGFSEAQASAFMEAGRSHHGLMFVTGPTGSGKSTTLYTCLNSLWIKSWTRNSPVERVRPWQWADAARRSKRRSSSPLSTFPAHRVTLSTTA